MATNAQASRQERLMLVGVLKTLGQRVLYLRWAGGVNRACKMMGNMFNVKLIIECCIRSELVFWAGRNTWPCDENGSHCGCR
mmetsp:Transcript_81996/g.129124  ORF Transcript_81996/g.129124 Transcript_81996/m.129124 type:complete len:82 (+) Transcript_81996:318-563(+)